SGAETLGAAGLGEGSGCWARTNGVPRAKRVAMQIAQIPMENLRWLRRDVVWKAALKAALKAELRLSDKPSSGIRGEPANPRAGSMRTGHSGIAAKNSTLNRARRRMYSSGEV